MKVLGAVRLSRHTDESTSVSRQREQIRTWASLYGHDVVAIAEDLDTSGKTAAAERASLGPWLSDPVLVTRWDILVCAKVDRISRNVRDFCDLIAFCQAKKKFVVSIAESFDLSKPEGRMVAQIMASVAEFERERTGERRREAAGALRQEARFGGGRVPYGYAAVRTSGGSGWILEPDPVTAPVVRDLASRMITGSSANSLCAEMNERGIGSPGGGRWHAQNLIRILRSPVLRGLVTTDAGVVRDDEGMPVRRQPVLDDNTWARLQQVLDSASHPVSGHRSDAALLLRVAFCGACSSPMYAQRGRRQGRDYEYYVDSGRKDGCQAGAVRMALLEDMVETALLHELGELPMLEKLSLPGDEDHSGEIREREEFLAEIDADYADGKISAERHHALAAIQEARIAALRALPSRPATTGWVETGETFSEHWAHLGKAERHLLLLDYGVRADVYRDAGGIREGVREVPSARDDGTIVRQNILAVRGDVVALVRLGDLAVLEEKATKLDS